MKVFLLTDEGRRTCEPAHDHATAEGACPKCGEEPFWIGGSGKYPSIDDRAWEAQAYCLKCRAHVGILRVETSTLFGVREDEAVLSGRCRVY